jgi:hypothetical protein
VAGSAVTNTCSSVNSEATTGTPNSKANPDASTPLNNPPEGSKSSAAAKDRDPTKLKQRTTAKGRTTPRARENIATPIGNYQRKKLHNYDYAKSQFHNVPVI